MAATRLVLEIERIHPESALQPADDKPVNFLVTFGRDPNGRPGKAFFSGSRAQKLQADLRAQVGSENLKDRRITIDVTGEWKTDREPRKRGGETVKDGGGKPIFDRHFEASSPAAFLEGPLLELFRIRRMARVRAYEADKLVKEGKKDEAFAVLREFADELGKLQRAAPSKTEEMKSVVAAVTSGTTNEPIGASPETPAPETASETTAPTVTGDAELEIVGDKASAGIQPTDAALAASRADAAGETSETVSEQTAEPVAEVDPEADASARLAKSGRDFVDSPKKLPYPVTEEGLKAVAEIYKEDSPPMVPEAATEPTAPTQPEAPPPPPTEKPVPQPPPVEKPVPQPSPAEKPAEPANAAPAAPRPGVRLPPRTIRPPLPVRRPGV